MAILKNGEIDLVALRKSKAKTANKTDLVAGLRQVSPEIEQLKVGQTATIENVSKANIRKVVMSVTAKLSHLTAKGAEWAGRKYETASDADAGIVYVQRQTGCKPEDAPVRRTGGGRRTKAEIEAANAAKAAMEAEATDNTDSEGSDTVTADSGVVIKEHA